MNTSSSPRASRRDIFTHYPAGAYREQIVRFPSDNNALLAMNFADAADRLAATHRGRAVDDGLLLPYLFLYRQALELSLKHCITLAASLRRNEGHVDPLVDEEAMLDRLKKKHGHRLMALVDELDKHLTALGLELTPTSARRTLTLVATSDPSGENFRYAGRLPQEQDHIDFPKLTAAVADAYKKTSTARGVLSVIQDYQYDAQEEYRAAMADYRP
jgi:hypothetical protein